MDRTVGTASLRFRIGRGMILVVVVVFLLAGVRGIMSPMHGEQAIAGADHTSLQASDPGLAEVIWHYNLAIWTMAMGIMVVVGVLAWRELPRRSRVAWYTITGVGATFLVSLLAAHVPIGHPGIAHWGPPAALTVLLLTGTALTAGAVFARLGTAAPAGRSEAGSG